MAHKKQGIDYFPLDVHLCPKFKFIEVKFGIEGFGIVIRLFQNIYAESYYMKWDEDVAELFAYENKLETLCVHNVVNECVLRGIFDDTLFKQHKILTSSGIQERYQEIVKRRIGVAVKDEYLLVEGDFGVNESTMSAECKHSASKNRQSKVNKKVNKKEIKEYTAEFEKFYSVYPNPHGKKQTFINWQKVVKVHGADEILMAAKRYGQEVVADKTEARYIVRSSNFVGQKGVYLDYMDENYTEPPPAKREQKYITTVDGKKIPIGMVVI